MNGDLSVYICQNRAAILINCEQKIAQWGQPESNNIFSVGERECMRLVAVGVVSRCLKMDKDRHTLLDRKLSRDFQLGRVDEFHRD